MSDNSSPQHQDNQFWIGLFLGGIIGAFLIVLMGTEKGRRLAKKIQDEGIDLWDDTKDKLVDVTQDARQQVTLQVERLETAGENLVAQGRQLIEKGQALEEKAVERASDMKNSVINDTATAAYNTLDHIEALQERGRQATAELKKKLFKNIPRKTA